VYLFERDATAGPAFDGSNLARLEELVQSGTPDAEQLRSLLHGEQKGHDRRSLDVAAGASVMVVGTHCVVLLGWSVRGTAGGLDCVWRSGLSREDVEHETKGFPGLAGVEAVSAAGDVGWFAENRNLVGDCRAGLVELPGVEGVEERYREPLIFGVDFVSWGDHGGGVQDRDGTAHVSAVGVVDGAQSSFGASDDETGRERVSAAGVVAYGFPGG
jgi:hypothetical protein